ncbi:MAG: hypothetical protein C0591_06305 [Marinilabiliales bacterium]|nr:MAG: hypothetical protein C0591_06305 [Marinilabiliales bacterium]
MTSLYFFISFISHFYTASLSPTGIQENDNMQLRLHPNPATSIVTLQSSFFNQQSSVAKMYDLDGKKLLEKQIPKGTESVEIDISHLSSGVYFIQLQIENKKTTKKLIIK